MQFSGLTNEEQWRLLNASMPLKELASIGGWESDSDDTGTDSSKLTPLQQRILDRQLEKEKEAMRSAVGQGDEELPNRMAKRDKPNKELVDMFNYGYEKPYTLKDNEFYYVEEATIIGLITYGVLGRVILFNEDKYAQYYYYGFNLAGSLIAVPYNHIWTRGIATNIHKVSDYTGKFGNFSSVAAASGSSISIGKNDEGEWVRADSDAMEELFPSGSTGVSFQWYESETEDWIYDKAPIEWADTVWDKLLYPHPMEVKK